MIRLSLLAVVAAACVVSLLLLGSGGRSPVQASQGNVNVHVHDTFFHPEGAFGTPTDHTAAAAACQLANPDSACDAQIHVGDTITWITAPPAAGQPHSVTECTDNNFNTCGANVDPNNPIGDSGVLFPFPNQWPSAAVQFTSPGTYYYRCEVHPFNMRGRVVVAQAPAATPSPTPAPTPSPPPAATLSPSGAGSPSAAAATSPTATPASVAAGGGPTDEGSGLPWYLLAVGAGLLVLVVAGISFKAARR